MLTKRKEGGGDEEEEAAMAEASATALNLAAVSGDDLYLDEDDWED